MISSTIGPACVTGATGFIGSHVCEWLRRNGVSFRILRRDQGRHSDAWYERSEVQAQLRGVKTLIHLAGRAHVIRETVSDSKKAFYEGNVLPTMLLAEEAVRAGVETYVFMSSIAARSVPSDGVVRHSTPANVISPYGISKAVAEKELEVIAGSRMRCLIFQPPLVYGSGMKGNPLRLFNLINQVRVLPFGAMINPRSVLYIKNLINAIETALLKAPSGFHTFLVADTETPSTAEFTKRIGIVLDRKVHLLNIPLRLLTSIGKIGDTVDRWIDFPFTTSVLERLIPPLVVDTTFIRHATGFIPLWKLDDGLRETAQWYRALIGVK